MTSLSEETLERQFLEKCLEITLGGLTSVLLNLYSMAIFLGWAMVLDICT